MRRWGTAWVWPALLLACAACGDRVVVARELALVSAAESSDAGADGGRANGSGLAWDRGRTNRYFNHRPNRDGEVEESPLDHGDEDEDPRAFGAGGGKAHYVKRH